MNRISRRDFLKSTAVVGAGLALGESAFAAGERTSLAAARGLPLDLAVATGDSPVRNCLAAVDALGGFGKFVHEGDRVVIKPNPIGTSPPEEALNTHPEMIGAVVGACLEVGAREVLVVSHDGMRSFIGNGIRTAAEEAGGTVKALEEVTEYREALVPRGKILRRELIATDVLDADVFINMPIAKHHAGSQVTLTMKNLMGVNWDRVHFHRTDLQQCIAEITTAVRHDLIIMDANHVLLTNGPSGPGDVHVGRQVIAGVDPVAVDQFTTRAFWPEIEEVRHIRIAYELGAGEIDLGRLQIREFSA